MQLKSIFILVLFVSSGVFYYNFTDASEGILEVEISRVLDGDTVETADVQKIRLKGINTPEKSMLLSEEAKNFLEEQVLGKAVEVESFGQDKYGRILGYLFLDGENVNVKILEKGLGAAYYYEEDEFYDEMIDAEAFARINELGIWKKSSSESCVRLIALEFKEPEKLVLENLCSEDIDVVIKDDATHIYRETLRGKSIFEKEFSHIWNNNGDSLYVTDDKGLLIFHRY